MNVANVCRICLTHDTPTYTVNYKPLTDFYEKITSKQFNILVGRSSVLCFICYHLLRKCHRFTENAIKADDVLQQICNNEIQPTASSTLVYTTFTKSPTEYLEILDSKDDFDGTEVTVVKNELLDIKNEAVKRDVEDNDDDKVELAPLLKEDHLSTDSEDDVPLKAFSSQKTDRSIEKRRVKKNNGSTKKVKNAPKTNAREVILTKEEQMEQLLQRSKSLNYLHSPLKCGLCYRGFLDQRAYENHARKHDERSGPYECEICHMRYRTLRHLRTHTRTCHDRRYKCDACGHASHTASQAREHEKWHKGFTYECQLCSQKFRKPTSYLTHMRKRHPTEHVCDICGDCFVGSHGLIMHKRKAHWRDGETPASQTDEEHKFCAECNIQFVSLDAWKRHILSSVKHALGSDISTSCLECGIQVSSSSLRTHLRTHERARTPRVTANKEKMQLPCEQCGANFGNRSKLHAHIKRIHMGLKYNKNIVCEVCGKKCTSNASLRYHQRTHTGERPFGCAQCAKRFADKNQLRIHVRTHTGERPYCCAVCGKRFSQKPALNRHYRVHTGAKPYDCQFCSKTFSQSNSLKLHVNTVHLKLPHAKKKVSEQSTRESTEDMQ